MNVHALIFFKHLLATSKHRMLGWGVCILASETILLFLVELGQHFPGLQLHPRNAKL